MNTFKKYYTQELEFRDTMEKAIETRLELLKQGIKPDIFDESANSNNVSKQVAKAGSSPNKQDLEAY